MQVCELAQISLEVNRMAWDGNHNVTGPKTYSKRLLVHASA